MKRLHVSVGLPAVADTTYWRLCRKQRNHLSWTHSAAVQAPHQPLHGATAADGRCAFVYIQHICRSGTPRLLVAMGTGYQTWLQSLGEIDLWPHSRSHTSRPPLLAVNPFGLSRRLCWDIDWWRADDLENHTRCWFERGFNEERDEASLQD